MVDRAMIVCSLALLGAAVPICALAEVSATASAPALTWHAPESCPAGDLALRVATLVGLEPSQLAQKQLRVNATVRPSEKGWRASLYIETAAGSGERHFEAEDCTSLIKGAALVIALTIDPAAASAHAEPAPVVTNVEAPRASPTRASPRPLALVRPLLAADLGILPDIALVYGVAVGVAWPGLRLEVEGLRQSAQTVSDGSGRTGQVSVPLVSGARVCVAPWRPAIDFEPAACLGAGLTWLRSTGGKGIAFPETHDTLSIAASGGVAVGWRLRDWLWLRAEASLGLSVVRPNLQVMSAGQSSADVYSARWLTGRIGGGLELRL